MARYFTVALLGFMLVSTFTIGVATLTGVKASSLFLQGKSDLLLMTPSEF
jgi:hypothetical protein